MKTKNLIISGLILFATIAGNANLAEVEATVRYARATLGSEDVLQSVEALRYHGSITLHQGEEPITGVAVLTFQKPDRQKIEFIFQDQTLVTGFNGWEAFEYVEIPSENEGEPPVRSIRSVGGDELRRNKAAAVENLSFFRPFAFNSDNIVNRGFVEIEGIETHSIDFVHNDQFVFRRFFDRHTGRLVRTELDTGIVTVESGQILVEGIRFAPVVTGFLHGELHYEMEFDNVEINPAIPDGFFDFPSY